MPMVEHTKSRLLRKIQEIIENELPGSQGVGDRLYTQIEQDVEAFTWELQENLGKAFTSLD